MPSTARLAGAPACSAASTVPSPPRATMRSASAASPAAAASGSSPCVGIWLSSTPCSPAQRCTASRPRFRSRLGWTTRPKRVSGVTCLRAAGVACRGLGGIELLADEVEAGGPEAGIGEVDADDAPEVLGQHRSAGGEHLQVLRHERRALLSIAAVHAHREQLPVGVGV